MSNVTAIIPTTYGEDVAFHVLSNGRTVLVSQDRWHGPTVAGHPAYWRGWRDVEAYSTRREIIADGELYRLHGWRFLRHACPYEQGMIAATENRYYKLRKQWRQAMANY